jgi:hypothetical protein
MYVDISVVITTISTIAGAITVITGAVKTLAPFLKISNLTQTYGLCS